MVGSRWLRAGLAAGAGLLLWAVPASATVDPLPALAGVVQDACTGLPVPGASVALVSLDGQSPPGPPIRQGALFAYSLLPAGDYALGASAPGYQTIGGDENGSTAPGTGAPFSIPPGPPILPAGAAVSTHLAADVRLVPPDPCTPPGPPVLPALSGAIRDAGSGRLIPGATLTLTPTAGQQPPGPPERLGGLFTFPSLAAGPYTLTVSAPGYRAITGIPYICPPGPPVLPSGASLSFTTALDIQLVR